MSKQTKTAIEKTRKKIWLVDSKGLIVESRKESIQHFNKPWAHDHEPLKTLLNAVKAIKPTVLIGSSGVGKTFTKEVVEAMTAFNEKPIILALSNPTSQSECTAEEAYTWSQGRAIFASGSPFDAVEYNGKNYAPGQPANGVDSSSSVQSVEMNYHYRADLSSQVHSRQYYAGILREVVEVH